MEHNIEECDIEHDIHVRMKPIFEYKIRVRITSVTKPGPKVHAPEVLMDTHLPSKQR